MRLRSCSHRKAPQLWWLGDARESSTLHSKDEAEVDCSCSRRHLCPFTLEDRDSCPFIAFASSRAACALSVRTRYCSPATSRVSPASRSSRLNGRSFRTRRGKRAAGSNGDATKIALSSSSWARLRLAADGDWSGCGIADPIRPRQVPPARDRTSGRIAQHSSEHGRFCAI
jgi:hypothetical protein